MTVIASGIFAVVAIVALGCERILEDIRDGRTAPKEDAAVIVRPAARAA